MDSLHYPAPPDSQAIECAGREEIRAVQNEGLRRLMARVKDGNLFYQRLWRQAGVNIDAIRDVTDLRRLPLITRDDLERDIAEHPPFGAFQGPCPAVRIQASSGTMGRPKPILHSRRDWDNICNFWARRLKAQGVRPGDLVQDVFSYSLFIPGFSSTEGIMRVGATVIPTGSGAVTSSQRQIQLANEWGTTVFGGVPAYIMHLAEVAEQNGLDPRKDFKIRITFHGGEPFTAETRRNMEERWGCKSYDNYGSVEQGAPTWECEAQDGHHVNEDAYYFEVVDPKTREPLPDGETGALVVTTLFKECAPVIRYMIGDITALVTERCKCGRTFKRLGGIRGRIDDMLKIRGVTIYPSGIEKIVRDFREVAEYRLFISEVDGWDTLTVRAEPRSEIDVAGLEERLRTALKANTGLTFGVEILAPRTLTVEIDQMLKPRRIIDQRVKK